MTLWRWDGTSQQINSRADSIMPFRVLGCLHCPLPLRLGPSGWKPREQARRPRLVACRDHHVSATSAAIGSMVMPNHRGPCLTVDAQLLRRGSSTGLVRLAGRSGISVVKTIVSRVNEEEHNTAAEQGLYKPYLSMEIARASCSSSDRKAAAGARCSQ